MKVIQPTNHWNAMNAVPFFCSGHLLNFEFEWLTLYKILNFWVSKISKHNLVPNQSIHGNISDEKEFAKHCSHGLITLGKWIGFRNSKYFNRFSLMSVSISFNTPQSYVLTLLLEVAKIRLLDQPFSFF